MKTISYKQIMEFEPCYDPQEIGMQEDYEDTIPNFIKEFRGKVKNLSDIRRTLLRDQFLTKNQIVMYAIWCARQVQHLMKHQRSINALDIAEKYINRQARFDELRYAASCADAADDYPAYAAAFAALSNGDWDFYAHIAARDAVGAAAKADASSYEITLNKQIDKLLEIFEGQENEQV